MALPLPQGLTPKEVAFLCEMEMVTIIPRQKLEALELLGGPTPALRPPQRAQVPLWLALLLKRQRRANVMPPPWLLPASLDRILRQETETQSTFSPPPPSSHDYTFSAASPPFLLSSTASASAGYLPYHWLEIGEILLQTCSDDIEDADSVRTLLRDLREVRMAKMRASTRALDGGGLADLTGIGAMEVAEGRGFVTGVMDGLRLLGAGREAQRRRDEDEADEAGDGGDVDVGSDDDMS